jgi:hypothetical protein
MPKFATAKVLSVKLPPANISSTKISSAKMSAARRKALNMVTVISFSLTFVGAGVALMLGLLPPDANFVASAMGPIDTGIVLLLIPLCALCLAILFEATRLAMRGPIEIAQPRPTPALSDWKPGTGEG